MTNIPVISIIGCGRVGKTLARLWKESKVLTIGSFYDIEFNKAVEAASFCGAGAPVKEIKCICKSDYYFIGVQDDSLSVCDNQLSNNLSNIKKSVIFHSSGALTSSILSSLRKKGAYIGSVHPCRSFAEALSDVKKFKGTPCAIEGEMETIDPLCSIFKRIGGLPFVIGPGNKILYHAATVILSNYLVALLSSGTKLLEKSGIEPKVISSILGSLSPDVLRNTIEMGPINALTGPIARGDVNTVSGEIKALSVSDPLVKELYCILGKISLEMAIKKGDLSSESVDKLKIILNP